MQLVLTDDRFTFYELTRSSCITADTGSLDEESGGQLSLLPDPEQLGLGRLRADREGDVLTLRTADPELEWTFDRGVSAPPCLDAGTPASDDPVLNFEVFWQSFDEQYAFFELQGVDWGSAYAELRPLVTPTTTADELFDVMSRALSPLHDFHVYLESECSTFSLPPPPDIVAHADGINRYLGELLGSERVTWDASQQIAYQTLDNGVGYVWIGAMEGFTEQSTPDWVADEMTRAGNAIDEALLALQDTPALIVDVRFNGGGLGGVALTLADRFADRKRLAFRKHARKADGFTPLRDFYVEPAGPRQYTSDVVLLTSALTASAAEHFVMAMRVLTHVVVFGEPSAGAHSAVFERQLPNGWLFGLSTEEHILADGNVYERVGIPPQVALRPDTAGLAEGHDVTLEAALQYLMRE